MGSAALAELPSASAAEMIVDSAGSRAADERRAATRYLNRHERDMKGKGMNVSTEVTVGDPMKLIRNVARQRKADIMPTSL